MDSIEQIKSEVAADVAKLKEEVPAVEAQIKEAPKWKLIVLALLLLCAAAYMVWSLVHTRPPTSGAVTLAAPAVTVAKVAGPVLKVPLQVVPKAAAIKHFPKMAAIPANEEVIDTADIPAEAAENGVQTVTFMNVSTGTASTVYAPKPPPWFALENRNAVGAAYLVTTAGPASVAYVKRDIFRVKDFHVGVVAGAGMINGKAGAGGGVVGELRF
jgi:hypothetical protein